MDNQPQQADLWDGFESAGSAFFKATGRAQRITILSRRKPTPEEATKKLPESHGGASLNVLAILDVEVQGVPQRWEVTSSRAIDALRAVVKTLPADVLVNTKGEGKNTTYVVRLATDEPKFVKGTIAAACDAPGCKGSMGHNGRHFGNGGAPLEA